MYSCGLRLILYGTAIRGGLRVAFKAEMDIYHVLFWACAALCAAAELLILRATFFPPADATPSANIPHSPRAIEILWGVLPLFALVALFWFAWKVLF
jgi:hypothetical protein